MDDRFYCILILQGAIPLTAKLCVQRSILSHSTLRLALSLRTRLIFRLLFDSEPPTPMRSRIRHQRLHTLDKRPIRPPQQQPSIKTQPRIPQRPPGVPHTVPLERRPVVRLVHAHLEALELIQRHEQLGLFRRRRRRVVIELPAEAVEVVAARVGLGEDVRLGGAARAAAGEGPGLREEGLAFGGGLGYAGGGVGLVSGGGWGVGGGGADST